MPKFLNNVDLAKNELQNARIQNLASDPSSPVDGQIYFHTGDDVLKVYNGSAFVSLSSGSSYTAGAGLTLTGSDFSVNVDDSSIEINTDTLRVKALGITDAMLAGSISNSKLATNPLARANHTGTQLAATISDFDTQVRTSRLDQMAAPTASVSLNSQKITGLADGTAATDAASWGQVQALSQGIAWKDSVRVATTAAITLATGLENGDTIDGITLATGDRVLVKNQAAGAENGIYVVAASGAPTRATDADTAAEVESAAVFVEEGTANANTLWVQTVDNPTLGTTALTFAQFNAAGDITAGVGLTRSGNDLFVNVDNSTIEINSDTLRLKDAGISLSGAKVTGTLPIGNGGTGQTTAKTARETGLSAAGYYSNATHGAGTTISITQATHGLRSSRGLLVQVQEEADGTVVEADIAVAANGDVTVTFAASQSANSKRVTIIG